MSIKSDGSTASYYQLPTGCTELQHLISYRDMNAQIGEIFRACYRYGQASHSDKLRDAKKILFYAKAEIDRLEKSNPIESNDGWIEWRGGERPVDGFVEIIRRGVPFDNLIHDAKNLSWGYSHHLTPIGGITAYRVVPQPEA